MKDDLNGLIRLWQPTVPEPSAFKREVWSRIERRGIAERWLERFLSRLMQPKIASLAAILAVILGAVVGLAVAGRNGQTAYLYAVNPYAQVAPR